MAKESKKLDSIINVDGVPYEVAAVEANRVKNTLKINKVNLADKEESPSITTEIVFDGSTPETLDLVTAKGGRFRGRIAVPADTRKDIDAEAVLNYGDIKNVILSNIKNNAIVYDWNGMSINGAFNNAINSISIVQGLETNADGFASFNNYRYQNGLHCLPTYLYIGTGENKVYYGTADSDTAKLLAINSAGNIASADKLTQSRNIRVNLSSNEPVSFNGTRNIDVTVGNPGPGVTGVLPLANGGLGGDISAASSQAAKTAEYYINGSIGENTAAVSDNTWMLFRNTSPSLTAGQYCRKKASALWTYIEGKIRSVFGFSASNVLSTTKGGTGTTSLSSVTVGNASGITVYTSTGSGATPTASYTTRKVIVSTAEPTASDGTTGDIWIKY
ncbi:MAG: hypothetical protein IKL08_00120, partial [Clostridia bacterium]|nr:hypothetical protein [Clostridia bacterium]